MYKSINIAKGRDLPIAGEVVNINRVVTVKPASCAVTPDDYHGLEPKVDVKVGDSIAIGTPIIHDKRNESIKICSPCCGTVTAIERGERRHVERVVITPGDGEPIKVTPAADVNDAEQIKQWLMLSGLWALMRQRPYDIVPDGLSPIRDFYVTGFDSAPLAVNYPIDLEAAACAVKLLQRLTDGSVYISVRPDCNIEIDGAVTIKVSGPHPAGNAGTIIAATSPVNKGETVVTLDIATLERIGRVALTGRYDAVTRVALCGPEVTDPIVVETVIGADIASIVDGRIKNDGVNHRIISGNVLTGYHVPADGYLRYPYRQVTIIAEGNDRDEFMGWASLSPRKLSASRSVLSRLFPFSLFAPKQFAPDARLMGGRRALIMSEEYDRFMPLDIMPEYLLKAIIGRDIERMEALGIYEVAPEDFALGEWGDTSKTETQRIVRQGLDYLRKELS